MLPGPRKSRSLARAQTPRVLIGALRKAWEIRVPDSLASLIGN